MRMVIYWRWVRVVFSFFTFLYFCYLSFQHQTVIYLIRQAGGQIQVLIHTNSFEAYRQNNVLTKKQLDNLNCIPNLKQFSVDSLGYKSTTNYTTVFDQNKSDTLWVITASEPFDIKAYEWHFPFVGWVSYKGYFNKTKADEEIIQLKKQQYDVSLSRVEAWSTLGWFSDPVLSSMLERKKGSLCNLIFHELFHTTYYAPNGVSLNENLAGFIAHKATLRYLSNDSSALNEYMRSYEDQKVLTLYMLQQSKYLKRYYQLIQYQKDKMELKRKVMIKIAAGLNNLKLHNRLNMKERKRKIILNKNAAFIDFIQYHSLEDSLELVFNKIYKGNIKKMLNDLKQN